jgi:hypothetical protein
LGERRFFLRIPAYIEVLAQAANIKKGRDHYDTRPLPKIQARCQTGLHLFMPL